MPVPTITAVVPARGPAAGQDLVRVVGRDFAERVEVRLGAARAEVVRVVNEPAACFVDVHTPPREAGLVEVAVQNVDAEGALIPDERSALAGAYEYLAPSLTEESDLARLVRALLRALKRGVLANTSARVSIDYVSDRTVGEMYVVEIASLPALVLSGPRLAPSRRHSTNVLREELGATPSGTELVRRRPPYTVDLFFRITGTSSSTVELLNLVSAVGAFINTTHWLSLPRAAGDPRSEIIRWELSSVGDLRSEPGAEADVVAFGMDLVVRGFDLHEGRPLDRGVGVELLEVEIGGELR